MGKIIDTVGLKAAVAKIKAMMPGLATTVKDGLLSKNDKAKLDNLFLTTSNYYSRLSKYIADMGGAGYVKSVEAYPVIRISTNEIIYYFKVATTTPCTVVVGINGTTTHVVEKPTINVAGENMANFLLAFPSASNYTAYKMLFIEGIKD